MQPNSKTPVQIFGQVYHIQGGQDPEYACQVAKLVDEKMNLIAARVETSDSFRIAVLAALHLADQCLALERRLADLEAEVAAKTGEMVALLDQVQGECEEADSVYQAV